MSINPTYLSSNDPNVFYKSTSNKVLDKHFNPHNVFKQTETSTSETIQVIKNRIGFHKNGNTYQVLPDAQNGLPKDAKPLDTRIKPAIQGAWLDAVRAQYDEILKSLNNSDNSRSGEEIFLESVRYANESVHYTIDSNFNVSADKMALIVDLNDSDSDSEWDF